MAALFETGMNRGALFSPAMNYRYVLWRIWQPDNGMLAWLGLNPSTADATTDDPTIRRCMAFAKRWGYGGIFVLNLFAFRATDPKVMKAWKEPIGRDNDGTISAYCARSVRVMAAWGAHGGHLNRDVNVVSRILHATDVWCLGTTKEGHPRHPLYVKGDTVPVIYRKAS